MRPLRIGLAVLLLVPLYVLALLEAMSIWVARGLKWLIYKLVPEAR